MTKKMPTLFVVTDCETTIKKGIMFDLAWRIIDRKGRLYGQGSFIIVEAFKVDVPYYREKFGLYFQQIKDGLIDPVSILEAQQEYNLQIGALIAKNHKVIVCAYNAGFDFEKMPLTLRAITGNPSAAWLEHKVQLMDIWQFWGESVPKNYRANPSASGKYVSTSAESAYRWEFMQPDFSEMHIAWHDCIIESEILLRALSRKKKLPLVNSPKDLAGAVWHKINTRLGIKGKALLDLDYFNWGPTA